MWDELPSVEVDPNALNTFAQGLGDTTSTLARQALAEMPNLSVELTKGVSMLNEGIGFDNAHRGIAEQFVAFLQDATAGVGALADAANTIALQYVTVDELNASGLLNPEGAGGDYSASGLLQLYDLAGSSAQLRATAGDVDEAFAPTRADDYNPVLTTLHGFTIAGPPASPAADTPDALRVNPVEQARRDMEQARRDAVAAAHRTGGPAPASTYHDPHGVFMAQAEGDTGPAVPLLDSQGRPVRIPADTSSQDDVEDAGDVDAPEPYRGDGALEDRLLVVADPPADDMPGGRR